MSGNQTHQDAPEWIKLNGVDERVGGDVEKIQESWDIVTTQIHCVAQITSDIRIHLESTSSHPLVHDSNTSFQLIDGVGCV